MSNSRLIMKNGRPQIEYNGEVISPLMYSDPMTPPHINIHSKWADRIKMFCDKGVDIYTLNPARGYNCWFGNQLWTDEDIYPNFEDENGTNITINQMANYIISINPNAKFFIRFTENVPDKWAEKNPDSIQKPFLGEKPTNVPSYASQKGKDAILKYFDNLIKYCEGQKWAERIIGYIFFPLGEGITPYSISGNMFDSSDIMQIEYNKHIRQKYKSIDALNQAWETSYKDFSEVFVPTNEQWLEEIKDKMQIVYQKSFNRFKEYFTFHQSLCKDWFKMAVEQMNKSVLPKRKIIGLDFAKQTMLGWQIVTTNSGKDNRKQNIDLLLASGCFDFGDILDFEGYEMVVTPADYTARSMGMAFESEGVSDSLLLRNKAIFVENDSRTYLFPGESDTLGAFKNDDEVLQGSLRNFAWGLTRGQFVYCMNVGYGFFADEKIMKNITNPINKLLEKSTNIPHNETKAAIALIIDDGANINETGITDYQNISILWQRLLGLSHCGMPYRIYLFSDLYKENMPDYQCYLFPNLFEITPEKKAILDKKVFSDNKLSIFGPLTGIYTPDGYSSEMATELFGVEMELIQKQVYHRVCVNKSSNVAQRLPSITYGDSLVYGPLILPSREISKNADITEIGDAISLYSQNRTGLFITDKKTHKTCYSFAFPIEGEVIKEIARECGCHIWCENSDVIMASENIFSIHSTKAGQKEIKLPFSADVIDMTNDEIVAQNCDKFTITMKELETRIFELRKK